ncbi:MAG: alpha-amylase family glycosyl hydrolase [Clostridium sp.]|nr:alpha-amylase family glycosyl hydrolase [Clostridium sp.]
MIDIKNMKTRVISGLLALILISCALFSCACKGADSGQELTENIPNDNVRNWYEIFIYSFADSDGDRIGDFKGATEKLDYVRDLGFTGIWLMPIMPSPSYHKYDVSDYYDIDPQYGTLDDFKAFLARAHELDIKVTIDLVVNHTSNLHPWFQSSKTGADSPYRDYYNWQDKGGSGYEKIGDSYYECRFVSTMPDLNLDSDAVRSEISNIMKFWLEMGVDGFRLDAVTSYYTGDNAKNVDFLSWLNDEAKSIKPNCYIVGECWSDESTIAAYYKSGVDSFFYFPMSTGSGKGIIAGILDESTTDRGESYAYLTTHLEERYGTDALMALFLDNHDTDRFNGLIGLYDLPRVKAAYGMLAMMRGGTYIYYGDECGMVGSGKDPNKRIGMYWEDITKVTSAPPGTSEAKYPLGSVAELLENQNSLTNYVKNANVIRNAFPEIARGVSEIVESGDSDVCIIRRTWQDKTITIVLNLSPNSKSISLDGLSLAAVLDANLERDDGITYNNGKLNIDPWGIAILF